MTPEQILAADPHELAKLRALLLRCGDRQAVDGFLSCPEPPGDDLGEQPDTLAAILGRFLERLAEAESAVTPADSAKKFRAIRDALDAAADLLAGLDESQRAAAKFGTWIQWSQWNSTVRNTYFGGPVPVSDGMVRADPSSVAVLLKSTADAYDEIATRRGRKAKRGQYRGTLCSWALRLLCTDFKGAFETRFPSQKISASRGSRFYTAVDHAQRIAATCFAGAWQPVGDIRPHLRYAIDPSGRSRAFECPPGWIRLPRGRK